MRIIRLAEAVEQPWANGAGTTRALWHERDAATGRIILRVSIARLIAPAHFSPWPGMERTFLPLDPMTVDLDIDGSRRRVGQHQALLFSGDSETSLAALDRPGRALNIMVDRQWLRHSLAVHDDGTVFGRVIVALEDWHAAPRLNAGDLILPAGAAVTLRGKAAVVDAVPECGT